NTRSTRDWSSDVCSSDLGDTAKNGMSIGRCFVASCPCIFDRGVGKRREAMDRHFHHSVEELPIHAQIECWSFFFVAHSEKHTPTFPVEIQPGAEIDYKCPPAGRLRQWLGRPHDPAKRHNRNINAGHSSHEACMRTGHI